MTQPAIVLKPGREKSLLRRHPWIFEGAVERVSGSPAAGSTVAVRDADGAFLALAGFCPKSQIVARVWSWNEDDAIDDAWLRERIARAVAARADLVGRTDAMRLVNAESDGLPGFVADRYGPVVACQFHTAAVDRAREALVGALAALPGVRAVVDRSDRKARSRESLPNLPFLLHGEAPGPDPIEIRERTSDAAGDSASVPDDLPPSDAMRFLVDVGAGQKTGFYLDQRENRLRLVRAAKGRDVLNAFAYTGAFSVAAARGGAASVVAVDSSGPALDLGRLALERNELPPVESIVDDVFQALRKFLAAGRRFDLILLDPPKLASTKGQADRAARAYKDANLHAFRLLRPGGILMTYSCSGAISPDLFRKIVFGAALDAKVDANVVGESIHATDHPVSLAFPEGDYLKGLVCRVG